MACFALLDRKHDFSAGCGDSWYWERQLVHPLQFLLLPQILSVFFWISEIHKYIINKDNK